MQVPGSVDVETVHDSAGKDRHLVKPHKGTSYAQHVNALARKSATYQVLGVSLYGMLWLSFVLHASWALYSG